jgi:hypothetical protein
MEKKRQNTVNPATTYKVKSGIGNMESTYKANPPTKTSRMHIWIKSRFENNGRRRRKTNRKGSPSTTRRNTKKSSSGTNRSI